MPLVAGFAQMSEKTLLVFKAIAVTEFPSGTNTTANDLVITGTSFNERGGASLSQRILVNFKDVFGTLSQMFSSLAIADSGIRATVGTAISGSLDGWSTHGEMETQVDVDNKGRGVQIRQVVAEKDERACSQEGAKELRRKHE